jgi:hypothetical protein
LIDFGIFGSVYVLNIFVSIGVTVGFASEKGKQSAPVGNIFDCPILQLYKTPIPIPKYSIIKINDETVFCPNLYQLGVLLELVPSFSAFFSSIADVSVVVVVSDIFTYI